ncbi:MAG: hypothetical protein JF626_04595 [Polaromonas sp.]|nr:hypothetical protein [Polaromonas sp.]
MEAGATAQLEPAPYQTSLTPVKLQVPFSAAQETLPLGKEPDWLGMMGPRATTVLMTGGTQLPV